MTSLILKNSFYSHMKDLKTLQKIKVYLQINYKAKKNTFVINILKLCKELVKNKGAY